MSASLRIRNAIVICAAVASSSSSSPSILLVASASPSSSAETIVTISNKRRAVHSSPSGVSWGCGVPRGGSASDEDDDIEVDSGFSSSAVATAASGTKTKRTRKKSKSLKQKNTSNSDITMDAVANRDEDEDEDDDDDEAATDTTSTAKKNTISEVMKGKDAASILGDGIRQRANRLRRDVLSPTYYSFEERTLDAALVSVGLSLGTAGTDRDKIRIRKEEEEEDENLAYYQYGHRIDNSQEGKRTQRPTSLSSTPLTTTLYDYFIKSHGGTHIVQVLLSLLASGMGLTCLILPPFPSSTSYLAATAAAARTTTTTTSAKSSSKLLSHQILLSTLKYQLLQQTLILGMAKHASGLMGAILLGAMQIPNLGVRSVRRHLERVASYDPVGRYLFYCSLLVVWMGWFTGGGGAVVGGGMSGYIARIRGSILSIMNAASATATASAASASSIPSSEGGYSSSSSVISQEAAVTTQLLNTLMEQPPPWFLSHSWMGYILPFFILGPVLLREIISVIWVVSDVLSLIVKSSKSKSTKLLLGSFLSSCRTMVDGFLRVLLVASDEEWKSADSFQRQVILAGLVSRCSSVMELAVGGILFWDAIQSIWNFAFSSPNATTTMTSVARMPFKCALGKMACAHLYLNYLQSKKKMRAKTSTED